MNRMEILCVMNNMTQSAIDVRIKTGYVTFFCDIPYFC